MKAVILAVVLGFGGISAVQAADQPAQHEAVVRVLYEYPRDVAYENLGVVDVEHYRPGFREPTLEDATPKLKAKVIEMGGNALIVRDQKVFNLSSRRIAVTAEVLKVGE